MRGAALPQALRPGGRLLRHHIRRQALPLPRHLHLHPPPGRKQPPPGGRHGGSPLTARAPCAEPPLLPEPPAPRRGLAHGRVRQVWVLALGDIAGRCHLRVQPGEATPPATCAHPGPQADASQLPLHPAWPQLPAPRNSATLPAGQNCDFSGRGDHQQRRHQVAAVCDSYVLSSPPAPGASRARSQSRPPAEAPIPSGNITVFRQTSTHLQMVTTFGLELVIQLWPLFQVYITVGPQFRGQTRGESLPRLPRPCPAQPLQKRRGPAEPCTDPGCRALTA